MKKLVSVLLMGILLSHTLVASASEMSFDSIKEAASLYESNIIFSLTGGYWEFPTLDTEFTPDDALGKYESSSPSAEVQEKYAKYNELLNKVGILDSSVTYADVNQYELTQEEMLSLSTVEFSYYFDYRDKTLIQYYKIDWVNTSKTQGYVVWKDGVVFEYRRLS